MARPPHPAPVPRGPFSRPLRMREIPDTGLDRTIEALPSEFAAIAADAGIDAVASLIARYRIDRRAGGRLAVTGLLDASITQTCVATLESFESTVRLPIEIAFAPDASEHRLEGREARQRNQDHDLARVDREITIAGNDDQADPPDPIIDDRIDLGAVAMEFLVLSLDPYPKKPGVHFNDVLIGEDDEAEPSPFAALARLKDRP